MKNLGMAKAIELAGSQSELAKLCKKSQSTICDWLNGKKKISPEHVPTLVKAVSGKVQPHELRPDLPTLFPHPAPAQEAQP
ncbi:transcriptional regulator [Erwinia typographi]|uniref:Transcriptional regulator n=1 Tax=Erwinia typographi TaxID=371042 RepID=A0A0A3YWN0_9GAMM|nr:helix-turn-helix domain-containing protein [Erwinia typographi]KGT91262.1 transcriptional regulator [Erwinia typographi]